MVDKNDLQDEVTGSMVAIAASYFFTRRRCGIGVRLRQIVQIGLVVFSVVCGWMVAGTPSP